MEKYQKCEFRNGYECKRTLLIFPDHLEAKYEYLKYGKWECDKKMTYSLDLVKEWGFESLKELADWKIRRHKLVRVE